MATRIGILLGVWFLVVASASAQVVRFQTSLGDFDMVLNPTNDPRLQEHAENMLAYVEGNSYQSVWINRAAEDFVIQMGGFYSHTKRPPLTIASTRPVATFAPVRGEPAATINGLSNTVGTVSLALPGDGFGGTNRDAGTSSFFINLASNAFLDNDFTVFAAIPDLAVIDQIMALNQIDRTLDPLFGADPGNLAFTDVPLQDNGFQVFIERAFVVTDQLAIARARAGVEETLSFSAQAFESLHGGGGGGSSAFSSMPLTSALPTTTLVPEPASSFLALIGLVACALLSRRRRAH